jgi:hypothetical protein
MIGSRQKKGNPKNDEYYTPKFIFDALGLTFDLDVAAPEIKTNVPARAKFTAGIDGLSQPWTGLVWMNPPFSKTEPWADRFMEHGNGIALLPTSKAKWYGRIWSSVDGLVLLPSRFKFDRLDGVRSDIYMPTVLAAMGDVSYQALLCSNLGRVR